MTSEELYRVDKDDELNRYYILVQPPQSIGTASVLASMIDDEKIAGVRFCQPISYQTDHGSTWAVHVCVYTSQAWARVNGAVNMGVQRLVKLEYQ